MTLEQVKANQVTMRSDIDSIQSKMDRFLETILLQAQKEKDVEIEAEARRIAAEFGTLSTYNPRVINLDGSVGCTKPVQIPMINEDPSEHFAASAQHRSLAGEDGQYDAFYIPGTIELAIKTLPDPATKRIRALEKKVKAIKSNNIFG